MLAILNRFFLFLHLRPHLNSSSPMCVCLNISSTHFNSDFQKNSNSNPKLCYKFGPMIAIPWVRPLLEAVQTLIPKTDSSAPPLKLCQVVNMETHSIIHWYNIVPQLRIRLRVRTRVQAPYYTAIAFVKSSVCTVIINEVGTASRSNSDKQLNDGQCHPDISFNNFISQL